MKEKKSRIIRTIVLFIFILLFMFLTIRILPVNLTEILNSAADSVEDPELDGEGAVIYYGAISLVLAIGALALYVIAILIIVGSIIFLVCAIRNTSSSKKWVKYFNYFLIVCCIFMLISSVTKIILWRCGN